MSESRTLLQGKVTITPLPTFTPPAQPDAAMAKRLMLPNGELAQVYNSETPIHLLAYLEFPADVIRGGHYHRTRQEHLYLMRGEVALTVLDLETGTIERTHVREGDFVRIAPGTAHIYQTITPGHAIEFSGALFDPEDTVKYSVPV
ncbi:MAG: hypothetical protein ACYDBB_16405 [Armatimonadota bacterium]